MPKKTGFESLSRKGRKAMRGHYRHARNDGLSPIAARSEVTGIIFGVTMAWAGEWNKHCLRTDNER